jgi:hypothetical protein
MSFQLNQHVNRNPSKYEGNSIHNCPICSDLHNTGNKGVATGRGAFSLCSPSSEGKNALLNGVSLYPACNGQ